MIDLTHSVSLALDRLFTAIAFFMTYTCSYDHEIMQLPNTGGTLCVLPNVKRNWVIIKVLYRCLRWYFLSWHGSRLGFVTPIVGEVSLGPLGNVHHYKPSKQCR